MIYNSINYPPSLPRKWTGGPPFPRIALPRNPFSIKQKLDDKKPWVFDVFSQVFIFIFDSSFSLFFISLALGSAESVSVQLERRNFKEIKQVIVCARFENIFLYLFVKFLTVTLVFWVGCKKTLNIISFSYRDT